MKTESPVGKIANLRSRPAGASGDGAAWLRTLRPEPGVSAVPAPDRSYPLSFAQERLWYLAHKEGPSAKYNIAHGWHLSGTLQRDALEQSLQVVVRRHEALRTTISPDGEASRPVQIVHDDRSVPLVWTDLTHLPFTGSSREAERRAAAVAREPFDLVAGPLLRAHLFGLGPEAHLLLLVVHHIVFDGVSLSIFESELVTAYQDRLAGRPASLPPVVSQMGEYAVEQRRAFAAGGIEPELAFWRRYLDGAFPALEVVGDREPASPASKIASAPAVAAGSVGHDISSELASRVMTLARAERTTVFHVFVAAWSLVLSRHSGAADLVVGTPVANRERPQFEAVVGFLVNTLPLRVRLEPAATVRATLRGTRDSVLEAVAHADVPLDRLVQELSPPRVSGRAPLFQSLIAFETGMPTPESFHDLDWFQVSLEAGPAKFDLTLWVTETPEGLRATLDYAADLFGAERMRGMVAHFVRALEQMVANPDAVMVDLDLLSAAERCQLLCEWNATEVAYPRQARVEELFREQVARTPEAVALVCNGVQLTYRDLEAQSNRLAHHLRGAGVVPRTCVALHLERSVDFVVSVLAVLKLGAVYVPLELDAPTDRLAFVLEDPEVGVVLTRGAGPVAPGSSRVIDLGAEAAAIAACPAGACAPAGGAEDVAYVMYTSGSSGTPKGVAVPHRAIVRLVRGQNYATFAPGQRFLLLASPAFDASTFELWGPLLNGATCVIFPDRWPDLARLENCLRDERVSCLWLTASLFNLIVDQRPGVLATVSHVITGGEALSVIHVQRAFAALPSLRLTNGYGPTESTTFACTHEIARPAADTPVPIGRPLANTRCYILDTRGRLAPVGVPGELYLGGDGLACGYHRRPDLTAEVFVPDPFGASPGGRLYRTGDRCRWRADGTLEFLGRFDEQVKVRGFRVELREIELALAAHAAVAQAVVVSRSDACHHRELATFVVPRPGRSVTADALRLYLAGQLPTYMVPASFTVLSGPLPLTANGKIDRRALDQHAVAATPTVDAGVEPRVPYEEEVADLWRHVLGTEPIGVTTDFFAAGGSSLLALQLALEIERRFGRPFTLADLLAAPTIEQAGRLLLLDKSDPAAASVLRGRGPGVPLFHIPGAAGVELLPRAVAQRLEGECPYFDGLQYPGVDGREPPLDNVEDIATALIGQIRRVRPKGPYRLSGFCFGGLMAIEICRQFEAAGEVVEKLILWDTFPAFSFRRRPLPAMLRMLGRRVREHGIVLCLKFGWWTFGKPVRRWWASIRTEDRPGADRQVYDLVRTQRAIVAASDHARLRYQPGRLRAQRVSFFRSRQPVKALWEMLPLGGWEHIFDDSVDLQELDCDHGELTLEPAISAIAEKTVLALRKP